MTAHRELARVLINISIDQAEKILKVISLHDQSIVIVEILKLIHEEGLKNGKQ